MQVANASGASFSGMILYHPQSLPPLPLFKLGPSRPLLPIYRTPHPASKTTLLFICHSISYTFPAGHFALKSSPSLVSISCRKMRQTKANERDPKKISPRNWCNQIENRFLMELFDPNFGWIWSNDKCRDQPWAFPCLFPLVAIIRQHITYTYILKVTQSAEFAPKFCGKNT